MYVCICNAVTDRDIVTAAARGARSSDDLAQDLGVGLGCGRCMPRAESILAERAADRTCVPRVAGVQPKAASGRGNR